MKPKMKPFFKTFLFYVLIGCILAGIVIPANIQPVEVHAATVCPIQPGYERVSDGSVYTGANVYSNGDSILVYKDGSSYTTDSVTAYVTWDWIVDHGYVSRGDTIEGSFSISPAGCERYYYTPAIGSDAYSVQCNFCGTRISRSDTYVDLDEFVRKDYYRITISTWVDYDEYYVQDLVEYTKSSFLSDLNYKYNAQYKEETMPYTTVHNLPASTSHKCSNSCREAPEHTHNGSWDETEYAYTCDCTTTNKYVMSNYYIASGDSECRHQVLVHFSRYYCRECGEHLYDESKEGCMTTDCYNYYMTNDKYDYGTHPGTHTYRKKGVRYECTNTTSINSGSNYTGNKYYNVVCTKCGWTFYTESDMYKDTVAGKSKHYYYIQETTEDSCYEIDCSNVHSASGFTEEKKDESHNCGKKEHADYTTTYFCKTCGEIYKVKKYRAGCYGCKDPSSDETYWSADYTCHMFGIADYTYQTSESASDSQISKINDSALHTTKTLTCTTSTAYGDYICDKVVTALLPVEPTQTLEYGESINTQAYAKFLNGTIEIVTCQISYDPTIVNQEQTATLSYGEYSSTASKEPRTAEITLHLVRNDADVTVEVSPAEAGTAIGTGTYTIGSDVSVSVNASPGYEFTGWYHGDTLKSTDIDYTFTMPPDNLTLTARFTPKVYSLKIYSEFPSMGSVTAPASAAYKSSVTVTATPANGFTFFGWYDGATLVSTEATYTFTMPYYPYELMARFSSTDHTVSFDSKGGSVCESMKVQYLGTYGKLPVPTKAGYVFQGWIYQGVYITETTPVTIREDHTLTAVWEVAGPEFILVDFGDPYGKNSWSTDRANIGQLGLTESTLNLWLPEPSKRGYAFEGWYKTEDAKGNGNSLGDNSNFITRHTVMRLIARHTLHAGWKEKSYTLRFDSNGGSVCSNMTITYDRRYGYHASLPIPTKQGYTFAGWYASELDNNGVGMLIENETRVQAVSDQTLYAKWTKDAINILVKFDARTKEQVGLTAAESALLGYGSTIGQIVSGTKQIEITYPGVYGGYPITWCRCEDTESHSAENGWKEFGNQHYYVDFTKASTYTFPAVHRRGYEFSYWELLDGVMITPTTETQLAQNHTVYAHYTPKTYTVTLDSQGATSTNHTESVTVTFDEPCPDILVPTKPGYTFEGYYTEPGGGGTQYYDKDGQNENIWTESEDKTLYAKWEPKIYTVTFDWNFEYNAEAIEPKTNWNGNTKEVQLTKAYGTLPKPERFGYTFIGWYEAESNNNGTGTQVTEATILKREENHTLYAKWEVNAYTVTFDWNFAYNAEALEPKSNWTGDTKQVTFDAAYGTLPKPERLGYTFIGWYETESNNNGTGTAITEATVLQRAENHTLYAKWKVNTYTVTFDWNFNYNATAHAPKTNWTGNTKQVTFDATYGTLPKPERFGYTFIGWYEVENDNNGTGTQVTEVTILKREENHTLYAKWKVNVYTVILDQRGALIPGQTSFDIAFDAPLTDLTGAMPQKRGYTFHGYCSDKQGQGVPYFNETGEAILYAPAENPSNRFNAQNFVTILYAYWTQDEVEKPEMGNRDEPDEEDWTTDEDDAFEEEVTRVPANILIYADDYNAATGANTDKQPYLVQDSIPSTEQVAIRAKMDAWLLSYKVLRHAGIEYVPYTVTVTYQTQHEIAEEELIVSGVQTRTKTYMIPKTWAYYALESFGLYKPEEVTVTNDAFESPVTITVAGDAQTPYPSVERTVYGNKATHVAWPTLSFTKAIEQVGTVSYTTGTNANGPYVSVVLPEQYLISDVVGRLPDVEGILDILSGNAAWEDTTTYTAWSDKLTWDGTVVLDDTKLPISGAEYNDGILPEAEDNAPDTWYRQAYRSGIRLQETVANGTYASYASIRYRGDVNNVAVDEEIILYSTTEEAQDVQNVEAENIEMQNAEVPNPLIPVAEREARSSRAIHVNPIVIHTPVVCDGVIDTEMADTMCAASDTAELTLKEELNFFRLKVSNYGTHKMMLGYGEKDFLYALSGKTNLAQENGTVYNQVQFPFGVFVDVGADSYREDGVYDTTGDYYIESGTWLTVGEDEIMFYVPVTLQENTYTVNFRSISVNCPTNEFGQFLIQRGRGGNSQQGANINLSTYVAYDTMELTIHGCLKDFEITGTSDGEAQTKLKAGSQLLTLKKGNWFNYRFVSQGSFLSDAASVTITPMYYWIPEHGQTRVETDLYYTETINGTLSHYVQMGSAKDAANIHTVTNHDTSLAIAKNRLDVTARILSDTTFVGQVGERYTFTNVELNQYMRMLGGLDTTQLPTRYCPTCHVAYRDNETPACTHALASTGIKERAEKIQQEWYGQFYVPAYCYNIPKGTKSGYCRSCDKTCYVTGSATECDRCEQQLEDLQVFDFARYASMQTLTGKEAFFQTDGTILVAFEIVVTNDSGEEVRYTAWEETELAKQWKESGMPYKEGDVIRYYADKKFGDDYEVGGVE